MTGSCPCFFLPHDLKMGVLFSSPFHIEPGIPSPFPGLHFSIKGLIIAKLKSHKQGKFIKQTATEEQLSSYHHNHSELLGGTRKLTGTLAYGSGNLVIWID